MGEKVKKTLLFITVFFTGAGVLLVEILGTRILAPFFGSTIFVWSSLIITAMGALSIAYFFGGKIIDRWARPEIFYFFILFSGISLMLIMKASRPILLLGDKFGLRFGPLVTGVLLFFAPFFLMGAASPMVIGLVSKNSEKSGGCAGKVFAIGTLGSIFGALLSGFFLLPYFTLSAIFLSAAVIFLILAFSGFAVSGISNKKIAALLALCIVIIFFGSPTAEFKNNRNTDIKIVHQENGFYGNIKIVDFGGERCLIVDGTYESCADKSSNESTSPYILEIGRIIQARKNDENILLLGLGGGGMANFVSESKTADVVEIDPKITENAKNYFGFTEKPNINVFTDDARHFLRVNDKKYDIVAMDTFASLTIPAHLASKEYFELLKSRLNNNGLFVVNFVGNAEPFDEYSLSFIRTIESVFPFVSVSIPAGGGLVNLVIKAGVNQPDNLDSSNGFQAIDTQKTGLAGPVVFF